jgi:hypothetical protein
MAAKEWRPVSLKDPACAIGVNPRSSAARKMDPHKPRDLSALHHQRTKSGHTTRRLFFPTKQDN